MNFSLIDAERTRAGLSIAELSRRAGVAYSTYWFIREGKVKPQASTLKRYAEALQGRPRPKVKDVRARDPFICSTYRGYLALIADRLGFDPLRVVERPKARAFWRVRALALNATSVLHDVGAAELGRAIGESKQIVHWNLRQAEDMRDDPKIDALMREAARLIAEKDE